MTTKTQLETAARKMQRETGLPYSACLGKVRRACVESEAQRSPFPSLGHAHGSGKMESGLVTGSNEGRKSFDVYVTASLFMPADETFLSDETAPDLPLTKENAKPLDADAAMRMFQQCTQRVSVGYVRLVDVRTDATALEWHCRLGIRGELAQGRQEGGSHG